MLYANSGVCPLPAKANRVVFSFWQSIVTWLDRQANKWPKPLFPTLFPLKLVCSFNKNRVNLHPAAKAGKSICKSGVMTYTQVVCSHSSSAAANCSLPQSPPPWSVESVLINGFKKHLYSSWWGKITVIAKLKNQQFEEVKHGSRRTFYFCFSMLPSFLVAMLIINFILLRDSSLSSYEQMIFSLPTGSKASGKEMNTLHHASPMQFNF